MTFEELGIKTKSRVGRFYTTCPKCSDSRKAENKKKECLTVNDEPGNQWCKCHNCYWAVNLAAYERSQKIYEQAKMPSVRATIYSAPINEFLASRQISPATALSLGVYETKGGGESIICYPYYQKHQLKNVMFRRVNYVKGESEGPREWQIKRTDEVQTESIFWGLDEYDPEHWECIIVEGQTDRMTWVECGFKNVLSIPMGGIAPGSVSDKKLEFINEDFKTLTATCKRFYVITDNDEVGVATREAITARIGKHRCYKTTLPFGYKDSNEVYAGNVKKNLDPLGKKGIQELYDIAIPYPIEGIIRLMDVREEVMLLSKEGPKKGYLTGVPLLDETLSLKEKLMMVVTGIPAMGKSTWVRWYVTQLSKTNPELSWGLFTPENRPVMREYLRICEVYQGQSATPKYVNSMSNEVLEKAMRWTNDHFMIMSPERRNFFSFQKENPKTLKNLFGYIRTLRDRYGIKGFVIDAFNKIEHERDTRQPEEQYIGMVLDMILEFLDVEDMMGIIVAHPYKMEAKPNGNYQVPGLYHIKGSSAWNERADIGVAIHRNKFINENDGMKGTKESWVRDYYAPTMVDINKMKFDELGQEGQIEMYLDIRNGYRFTQAKPKYYISKEKPLIENTTEETFDPTNETQILPF